MTPEQVIRRRFRSFGSSGEPFGMVASAGNENLSRTNVVRIMRQPEIIKKPELRVVGFEASFILALSPNATNLSVIGPLWNQLLRNVENISNRSGSEMYGVIYARPAGTKSHADELQYVAGVAVSDPSELPAGTVAHTVPAYTFAVFLHRGPIEKIADTCREIYRNWLPQSGFEHAGIADIEVYDDRFHCEGDDSVMEYWVSVKPESLDRKSPPLSQPGRALRKFPNSQVAEFNR